MRRRKNGEGSYTFDRGYYRYTERYTDALGDHHAKQLYSKDKKGLQKKVDAWHNKKAIDDLSGGNILLGVYADTWLDSKEPTVRPRTYDDYERFVIIIKKFLGRKKLNKITVRDCQQVINDYAKTHAPRTANDLRRRLIILLGAAYNEGLIKRNPAKFTSPIHQPLEHIIALTQEDVDRMLAVVDKGDYIYLGQKYRPVETESQSYNRHMVRMMIYLAIYSGCRLGELLGLKWDCVNFKKSGIMITRSLASTRKGVYLDDVKTRSSYRFITLPAKVMDMLKSWKKEQAEYADLLQNLWGHMNLVLTNSWGTFVNSSNFYKRYWSKIVKAAKLPEGTVFHTLRKTHATLLLEQGVNIKVVSARLGHSSTSVTANVYAAILPSMEAQAVGVLDKMFENEKNNR